MSNTIIKNRKLDVQSNCDLANCSDEQLLATYRKTCDRLAFRELVSRYENELYSYLRRYLGDAQMAEDVFQATFLQVHLKCEQFDTQRKFKPWLYTVATNQAIDAQRRNRRHRMVSLDRTGGSSENDEIGGLIDLLVSDTASPEEELQSAERQQWIRSRVEDLPESLRAAVILVYYQGMKYREAADILNIPVGTIKSRLHAAIVKLNQAWTETFPNEGR